MKSAKMYLATTGLCLVAFLGTVSLGYANTIYVNGSVAGPGTGTKSDPYKTLEAAVTQLNATATSTVLDIPTTNLFRLFDGAVKWADNVPSLPVTGGKAVLIVGNANLTPTSPTATIDPWLKSRLEANGYTVEVVDDDAVLAGTYTRAMAESKHLVVISDTCASANLVPFVGLAVPMIHCDIGTWDDFFYTRVAGAQTPGKALEITSPTHPVANGLTGTVSVYTDSSGLGYSRTDVGQPTASAKIVARPAGSTRFASIFTIEKNAPLVNSSLNPERVVCFFLNASSMRRTIFSGIPESTINVAGGTYALTAPLLLPSNAKLLGGWNAAFNARNPAANVTTISGGGTVRCIQVRTTTGSLVIDGFTFQRGFVPDTLSGGAIYIPNQIGPSTITACTFVGNQAYEGSAVHISASAADLFTISKCTFLDNRARYRSALWVDANVGAVTVSQCTFTSNSIRPIPTGQVDGYGPSGLRFSNTAGHVWVERCLFNKNYGHDDGAAMTLATGYAPLWITNCTFSENVIEPNIGDPGDGDTPAIQTVWNYEDVWISDCLFERNISNNDFGAIEIQYMISPVAVDRCRFIGNYCPASGATITFRVPLSGTTYVRDCIFDGNRAGTTGAMIRWDASQHASGPTVGNGFIERCVFTRNVSENGAALFMTGDYGTGLFAVANCTFFNNRSSSRFFELRNMNYVVHNCTFTSNSAGAELIKAHSAPATTHDRINVNPVFGWTDAAWRARRMEVVNCIFTSNTQTAGTMRTIRGRTDAAYMQYDAVFTKVENNIFHNLIQGSTVGPNPGRTGDIAATNITLPTSGSFAANPKLVNPAAGDLHLLADSPAIDAGKAVDISLRDLDGVQRPTGAAFDIGAYEYYVFPSAPSSLQATGGNRMVSLTWTASTGYVDRYRIYISQTPGGPYSPVNTTTGLTYMVTGLTNGTPYYFVVRAVHPRGESSNSNEATATPQGGVSLRATNWSLYR